MTTRKATKGKAKNVQQANVARFHVNKDSILEREFTGIDWDAAVNLSAASGKFESSIVLGFFTGASAPTFDDFKAYVKTLEPKQPTPTKRSHNALYITLAHAGKIQEAIEAGFKPLEAWESYVIERTRKTEPNISALRKLARAFMEGEKVIDAGAEFSKALITAYRKALSLPNSAVAQYNVKTLAAIAAKNKINLPNDA